MFVELDATQSERVDTKGKRQIKPLTLPVREDNE